MGKVTEVNSTEEKKWVEIEAENGTGYDDESVYMTTGADGSNIIAYADLYGVNFIRFKEGVKINPTMDSDEAADAICEMGDDYDVVLSANVFGNDKIIVVTSMDEAYIDGEEIDIITETEECGYGAAMTGDFRGAQDLFV